MTWRRASVEHLAVIRGFLQDLATEAGVRDPDDFARRWHILMKGSIVAAGEGDRDAARRARRVAEVLLGEEFADRAPDADASAVTLDLPA